MPSTWIATLNSMRRFEVRRGYEVHWKESWRSSEPAETIFDFNAVKSGQEQANLEAVPLVSLQPREPEAAAAAAVPLY